ncbi:cps2J protein [Lapidilactobacillus concavus DSM 17758]|uniref:Cps2J protein n=1 Tax=Lapidilactobacillus concavus DSM 17758 TaxID=1423735 RepID=A0A0R1W0J3_9LACO|nr:glycosyltransferase [Lapidilactobacillus concavus]KRM07772.1 cps2J protein [Lapidilactobacillus concavus DSM 17758]GEL13707.1 putative glycosyltransferase EpsF [Lapidilactobacillus concavus]
MTKPIRVLHVIGKMDRAGAETMIMSLYRRIDRNKIQFDFMVHSRDKGDFDDEIKSLGGKIYYMQKFNMVNFFSYHHAWKSFLKVHPEYHVIHGHIGSSAFIYLSIAKSLGRKTIVHSHNSFSDGFNVHDHVISLLNYHNKDFVDEILAASIQAGKDRFGKNVVKRDNFHVFNNAIDSSGFLYSVDKRNEIRRLLGISPDSFVMGNVGRLVEAKNQKRLISIFHQVTKRDPDSQLLILGKGPLKNDLLSLTQEYQIDSQVHFVGVTDDVADYLSAMDVFVFPSLHEGLGISLIEAQCAGLPCIASDAVPVEAMVSSLLVFESLKKADSQWVDTIIKNKEIYSKQHRQSHTDDIKKAHYDISQTLPQISNLYLRLSGGNDDNSDDNNAHV